MKKIMLAVMALCLFTACQFEFRTESHSWSDEPDESEMTDGEYDPVEDEGVVRDQTIDQMSIDPERPKQNSSAEGGKQRNAVQKRQPAKVSQHTSDDNSYDNMRGFDPASEDDADDNGMSRYMENDDDEGWD